MRSWFGNAYQRLARTKSLSLWGNSVRRVRRAQELYAWYQNVSQLSEEKVQQLLPLSVPARPGDELFMINPQGNIIDNAITNKQYALLKLLISKGLSGCIGSSNELPESMLFTRSDFTNLHTNASLSLRPLPISKAIFLDDAMSLDILFLDKTGLLCPKNQVLGLYEHALSSSSFACLDLLFHRNFGITQNSPLSSFEGARYVESTPSLSGRISFLTAGLKLVSPKDLSTFFLWLEKNIDLKNDLFHPHHGLGSLMLRQSILRGNEMACLELLKQGICPNTVFREVSHSSSRESFLAYYPLFMASLSDNPSIVDVLLKFGAQWQIAGLLLGEELQRMSVMYTPTNIPKALPYALECYEKHKQSLLLRRTLTQILLPTQNKEEEVHRKM